MAIEALNLIIIIHENMNYTILDKILEKKHHLTCMHWQSILVPPPLLPHTNVDNVAQNTVQVFGHFLTNIVMGEGKSTVLLRNTFTKNRGQNAYTYLHEYSVGAYSHSCICTEKHVCLISYIVTSCFAIVGTVIVLKSSLTARTTTNYMMKMFVNSCRVLNMNPRMFLSSYANVDRSCAVRTLHLVPF